MIRSGKTLAVEEGMVDLMAKVATSGRVSVTTDMIQAATDSDVSLICVGTPSAPNGSQDQTAILSLSRDLGRAMLGKGEITYLCFVRRWCLALSRTS